MGYDKLVKAGITKLDIGFPKAVYEKKINLTSVTVSDWILIPRGIINIAGTVSFTGGGKGKIEVSTDSVEVIKSGSGITVEDSGLGELDDTTGFDFNPVTAIRLNQTFAGTAQMTLTVR